MTKTLIAVLIQLAITGGMPEQQQATRAIRNAARQDVAEDIHIHLPTNTGSAIGGNATVLVATIGTAGGVLVAFFGYLGIKHQKRKPA